MNTENKALSIVNHENIKSKIYTMRGVQVMIDRDLAELYKVKTSRLNEQVRRNIKRFPARFMFQLTKEELKILRSQFATANISISIFVLRLIRKAKTSLILIDNYIDETVLTTFDERSNGVEALIVTKDKTEKLELLLEKHNKQYASIRIQQSDVFHDRFLIIDEKEMYHLGASIKDLGKKCFAFSKIEDTLFAQKLLDKICCSTHA